MSTKTIDVPVSEQTLRRVAAVSKGKSRRSRAEIVHEALNYYLVSLQAPERLTPEEEAAADEGLEEIKRGEGTPLREALHDLDRHHFAKGKKRA